MTDSNGARNRTSGRSDPDSRHHDGLTLTDAITLLASAGSEWGDYEPAVWRWELLLCRPAPEPSEPNSNNAPRLRPAFSEWLMGLPDGWVTDVPELSRTEQLKALGNGVVPQQAEAAIRCLLHRISDEQDSK